MYLNIFRRRKKKTDFHDIRPLVKRAYPKINFIISQRGYSKEPSQGDDSFEKPIDMLKLMGKNMFKFKNIVYLNV